jgi:hypothetical protein
MYIQWSISPRRSLPLWVCRGWGSFLVHSKLWGWPHLCAELDGNGFFLAFSSFGNFLVNKSEKNRFRKVPILACFFNSFCPFGFLFYMQFNNVHKIVSTNLTNIHKCLEKILFTCRTGSFFCRKFLLIHFGAKKVFFLSISGCWSNWWKQFRVHCWTSC